LKSWGDGPVPAYYATLRRRWDIAHLWRTFAGLVALICLIVSMLIG
jgi:hypothetical protein